MKKKSNKFLPYIIAFVVILIIVLVVGKKKGWFGKNFEINVATKVVESRTITELITANGKVQPETEIKISPDVSVKLFKWTLKRAMRSRRESCCWSLSPIFISSR